MNEAQRQEWNAAVASGDEALIARLQEEILAPIRERQLASWNPIERQQ